jgi:hypothetical protein
VVDVLLVDVFVLIVEEFDGRAGGVGASDRKCSRREERE